MMINLLYQLEAYKKVLFNGYIKLHKTLNMIQIQIFKKNKINNNKNKTKIKMIMNKDKMVRTKTMDNWRYKMTKEIKHQQ